jgi:hypothetical protein
MGDGKWQARCLLENFKEAGMKNSAGLLCRAALCMSLAMALGSFSPMHAQVGVPKYEVDPTWPKPLPGNMVTGRAGGICVDAQDHVFEVNRGDLQDKEKLVATPAPPVLEYDSDGNLVNSFGDFKIAPSSIHGCIVDKENNLFVAGNDDAVVQKYTHDGSKLLLTIGTKGLFDSSTGLITGIAMNQSKSLLNKPADIAIDPGNGDVYIADGYGDHRIVVFDKDGKFLRQWGRQGTKEEAAEISRRASGSNRGMKKRPIHGAPPGGCAFLAIRHRNSCTSPMAATSSSIFSTMRVVRKSLNSGAPAIKSANSRIATRWTSTPRATSTSRKPISDGECRNLSL